MNQRDRAWALAAIIAVIVAVALWIYAFLGVKAPSGFSGSQFLSLLLVPAAMTLFWSFLIFYHAKRPVPKR